jgi:hypothetical protein
MLLCPHPRIVIEITNSSVFWLNAFPHCLGISTTLTPRTIITGKHIDFNKHCRYEFGQYVQTHEEHDNSMQSRTVGVLAMRPTGNDQGDFFFFSLCTGRLLNRVHATPLPMPDDVINRVNAIGRRQKASPGLLFTDRSRQPIADDIDNDTDDGSYTSDDYDGTDGTVNDDSDDGGDDPDADVHHPAIPGVHHPAIVHDDAHPAMVHEDPPGVNNDPHVDEPPVDLPPADEPPPLQ